jgi:hypothetical protein
VPDKEERTGAHRNGGSTVRRRKWRRTAAFVGREGAPLGGDGGCGVLQHRRGKGVRKLQEIDSTGRSSPGSGRRRRCSAGIRVKERLLVARGGGMGVEIVGREAVLERGAVAGSVSRGWTSGRGRALSGSIGDAAERERKERGGPAAEVPRGAGRRRGAWPRPCPGRPRPGCDARGRRVAVRTAAH